MGEKLKEIAEKVIASIKKVLKPSQEELKDPKEEQDSTTVNNPGQPGPLIGPSGF